MKPLRSEIATAKILKILQIKRMCNIDLSSITNHPMCVFKIRNLLTFIINEVAQK